MMDLLLTTMCSQLQIAGVTKKAVGNLGIESILIFEIKRTVVGDYAEYHQKENTCFQYLLGTIEM